MKQACSRSLLVTMVTTLGALSPHMHAHSQGVTWELPDWAPIGAPIQGTLTFESGNVSALACTVTYPDGQPFAAEVTSTNTPTRFTLTLPAPAHPGTVEISLHWTNAGKPHTATHPLRIADSLEIEISGVAAEPLNFPLKGWPADVLFVPCCNIYGGILTMLRFSDNPVDATGLPPGHDADFVMAKPDEMVRGTAGLSLVFAPGADRVGALTIWQWKDPHWEPAFEVERNTEHGTLAVACPNGGLFVLAPAKLDDSSVSSTP